MEKTLKEKTTSALIWSFIDKFGQQIIYIVTGIVLGRTLSPDDYGLIGTLSLFIALSSIFINSGYGHALMNRMEFSQTEYNTVFYYNAASGFVLYAILFFCAPLISLFFKQPSLTLISRVLFLCLIFNSFVSIQNVYLTKKMNVKVLSRVNILALLIASIFSLIAALKGMGPWALVIQTLLNSFFGMILYWYYSEWRPTRSFDRSVLKRFFPFSSMVLLTSFITTVFNNIYSMLIGRIYSITQLGFYTQASKYQDIPTGLVSNTFRTILVPLLSDVNDDAERFKRILSKLIKTISLVIFPIMFGLILVAKQFFVILITEKWLASVPIFQILCFSGIFVSINTILQESILAKGRSKELLILEFVKKSVLVLLILITIQYGTIGLALGWSVSSLITLLISLWLSKKIIGYSVVDLIKDSYPYFLLSLGLCAVAYFICKPIVNDYLFLGIAIFFVGSLYILSCKILKLEASNDLFLWIEGKIKKLQKKN